MHATDSMFHPISHCEEVLQDRAIAADLNDDAIEDKSKQAPAALTQEGKRRKKKAVEPCLADEVQVRIDNVLTKDFPKTRNDMKRGHEKCTGRIKYHCVDCNLRRFTCPYTHSHDTGHVNFISCREARDDCVICKRVKCK